LQNCERYGKTTKLHWKVQVEAAAVPKKKGKDLFFLRDWGLDGFSMGIRKYRLMFDSSTGLSQSLSKGAQRVQQVLEALGLDLQVVELPNSTRTAQEAAKAIDYTVGQIAKSLVFHTWVSGL
jgi:hypothetical protein